MNFKMERILTIKELLEDIKDEKDARELFEYIRWPNGIVCPMCGSKSKPFRINRKSEKREILKCKNCKKEFSITTGTILKSSHIPFLTWLYALILVSSSKSEISSYNLSKMLGITKKSAKLMLYKIRYALENKFTKNNGIVLAKEAFYE